MISVKHLCKSYGALQAVKEISFEVEKGEFFGLLGPNGAGKTSTISMMSTILQPDKGSVRIAGYDLGQNPKACKQHVGVVPQEIALYNELSALDNLLFWGSLYEVPRNLLKKRIDETLQLFGLYDRRKDKVKTYSGGMKRRINIASALLHQPQVLLMDEPTVGIDPQSRNLIFEVIEKLHREGMTIIYTTHYMEEAERFCNRVAIMDKGEIMAMGSLRELKEKSGIKESALITVEEMNDEAYASFSVSIKNCSRRDNTISVYSEGLRHELSDIILYCNKSGLTITHIDLQRVNLESIFLKLTGKQLRD